MSSSQRHEHNDPTFEIANRDTSDDAEVYADPEQLEARHEQLEEHLAAIGALPVKVEVVISTKAQELQERISGARFRSELKDVARDLTMALAREYISNKEYQALYAAYQEKVTSLTPTKTAVRKPVTRSAVSDDVPDWRQRQMNDY